MPQDEVAHQDQREWQALQRQRMQHTRAILDQQMAEVHAAREAERQVRQHAHLLLAAPCTSWLGSLLQTCACYTTMCMTRHMLLQAVNLLGKSCMHRHASVVSLVCNCIDNLQRKIREVQELDASIIQFHKDEVARMQQERQTQANQMAKYR